MIKMKCLKFLVIFLIASKLKLEELKEICLDGENFERQNSLELEGEFLDDFFESEKAEIIEINKKYELKKLFWNQTYFLIQRFSINKNEEELIKKFNFSKLTGIEKINYCVLKKNYIYFFQEALKKNLYDEDIRIDFVQNHDNVRYWNYRELAYALTVLNKKGYLIRDLHPLKIKYVNSNSIAFEILDNLVVKTQLFNPVNMFFSAPENDLNEESLLTEQSNVFSWALLVLFIEFGRGEFEKKMGTEFLMIMNEKFDIFKHEVLFNVSAEILFENLNFRSAYYNPGIWQEFKNWFFSFFTENSIDRIYSFSDLLIQALSYNPKDRFTLDELLNKIDLLMINIPDTQKYQKIIEERREIEKREVLELNVSFNLIQKSIL